MTREAYAQPEEIRRQLGMESETGTASDPALVLILQAISDGIDNHYNNPVGFIAAKLATPSVFGNYTPGHIELPYFIEVTEVMSGSIGDLTTEIPITDVTPYRGNWQRPNYFRKPYMGLIMPGSTAEAYQITAKWGFAEVVPRMIKELTIALAIRAFKQGESGWSDVLASFDMGQMVYARENSDLRMMLKSGSRFYRNVPIA